MKVNQTQSALSPERVEAAQRAAEAAKAKADFSAEGYGKEMALSLVAQVAAASGTWCEGVVYLLKSCNDTQQEKAMSAAVKVAEGQEDAGIVQNLRKRISEARRVFKASREDYSGVLKIMEGKGSWHSKVAKLPKASTKGRKAGEGAGKSTKTAVSKEQVQKAAKAIIGKAATEAQVVKLEDYVKRVAKAAQDDAKAQAAAGKDAKGAERIAKQDVGAIVDAVRKLSFADARKVLDVVLFHLSNSNNEFEKGAAKKCMELFDASDKASLLKATG